MKQFMKPVKRSRLRLVCGRVAYTAARYLLWCSPAIHFARQRQNERLPAVQASHHTPLMRRLRNVDMQYQTNKVVNLRLAVARLDGLLVRPGETFSYWRLIGKPTYRRGFVDGMVLNCGSYTAGVGGGLCQLSNLIFWMTLHTPLTITERFRHSYDVFPDAGRTQPFGSGATCVYPYRDLMIRNDTADVWQLCLRVGETDLEGEWRAMQPPLWRYTVIERDHCIRQAPWGGYLRHNALWRVRTSPDGEAGGEEFLLANDAIMMYDPYLDAPKSNE